MGKILDQDNYPVEMAAIVILETQEGTTSNSLGRYEIQVPANTKITLVYTCLGYENTRKEIFVAENERMRLNVSMLQITQNIDEVRIIDERYRHTNTQFINPKLLKQMPGLANPVMDLVKSLPGVAANNELSSQYSVRGGNYDENLIYVNGIEVYKPFLVRSGQQEGMHFVNSDMIANLSFSSGGFESRYGDKMSSVLDIEYRRPNQFNAKADIGFLGGSATIEGVGLKNKFSHLTSVRYKQTRNVLGSLETKGEYDPRFLDVQTLLTYDLNEYWEVSFLGYFSDNIYNFKPSDRETRLGLVNNAFKFKVYFEGFETDRFLTSQGSVAIKYKPSENNEWRLSGSTFYSLERETFDILGEYWLNQVDANIGSSTLGDSIGSLAVGRYLDHARNYLDAVVSTVSLTHKYRIGNHKIQWGINGRHDQIKDKIGEWMLIDSAGYSIPYHSFNDSTTELNYSKHYENSFSSFRSSGYIQDTWNFDIDSVKLYVTGGVRYHYWDFNEELLFSPRVSLAIKPNWKPDLLFRFSSGIYYQPPFYKEALLNGVPNNEIKSQKSTHAVLAADYNFNMWNRPFKLVVESYYKQLKNIIPYTVDNVRIIYDGYNHATGYVQGIDMKLTGEFVKGVDSWLSISYMKTEEDITDDVYIRTHMNPVDTVYPGFIPRPTDQRFMINLFFQDYWPGNPTIKVHLNAIYNTGLPVGAPNAPRHFATHRLPGYKRIDMGISKEIIRQRDKKKIFNFIENIWIGLDVFNILDIENTISYTWITDIQNQQFGIPNKLTGRLYNLKMNITF
ncbi:MAG: carboxypeptidase-like regulatory domain-containing protein [Salinivirgaceae bacterium]|nr:carboxypeptidase-like regulatory domain-containing protein [Salinivirgaceae bacterium]